MSRTRFGALPALCSALLVLACALPVVAQAPSSALKKMVIVGLNSPRTVTVKGTVVLRAAVPDTAGVKSVIFYLNGSGIGTVSVAPYRLDWDSTFTPDGDYNLKVVGSNEAGSEVWTGEGKIVVANKTAYPPVPAVPVAPAATTPQPAHTPPAVAMTPVKPSVVKSPVSVTTPKPTTPARPPAAVIKPATVRPTAVVKPTVPAVAVAKPVIVKKPMVVAQAPPKPNPTTAAMKPMQAMPKMTTPAVKPAPHVAPAPARRIAPVRPVMSAERPIVRHGTPIVSNPAQQAWKGYENAKYGFTADYPASTEVRDESTHMKPKGPGSFWIAFTQTAAGKPSYAINVRHMKLNEPGSPDKFAKYNPYLLSWDRTTVAGIEGFKTVSKFTGSKRVIHRTLLVDSKEVWMLNVTDVSGNDPSITGAVFQKFLQGFKPGQGIKQSSSKPGNWKAIVAPITRTGAPTPPPAPVTPSVAPAPESTPDNGGTAPESSDDTAPPAP
jgi:hypothetical protein